jgi:uncharacterized protein (TIGR04222 family)
MERDPTRNGLRLPPVAPLAIVEPLVPEIIPPAADRPKLPVPLGRADVVEVSSIDAKASEPDPYEVAYLRGGGREVLRLHLFDLVQRGYLEIIEIEKWLSTERRLARSRNAPPYEALSETQQAIVGWFDFPLTAKEIRTLHTREPVAAACELYRARLEAKGELAYLRDLQTTVRWAGIGAAVILVWAGWDLVGYVTAIAAHVAALTLFRRLSRDGRDRLKTLEASFSHLKDRPRTAELDVADPALVMAVAIFGTAVLVGSPYDAFAAAAGPDPSWSFSVGLSGDGDGDGDGDGGCGGCGGCD